MPWIDVREPHAALPNLHEPTATAPLEGVLHPDRGEHHFDDVVLDGSNVDLGLHTGLVVESSIIRNVVLCPDEPVEVDASWCSFTYCDLSRADVNRLRASRLSDCKFVGTDFSDADVVDVVFERCLFSLANLRMARFTRVSFDDCTLRELDAFELVATDVSFDGSDLDTVNVDRLKATRVDLRDAKSVQLDAVGRLDGFLVAEHQLPSLVYQLAFAVGLGVEHSEA